MNPPAEVKVKMCKVYQKEMVKRFAKAVGEYNGRLKEVSDLQTTKVCGSVLAGATMFRRDRAICLEGSKADDFPAIATRRDCNLA